MRRVIISGGGTGGHIYPALTIAEEMARLQPTEFLFVGSEDGLESELVPKAGYPFTTLRVHGLQRRLTLKNFKSAGEALSSMAKARTLLREFRPEVVIGTGGYVCGPIVLAAALQRIPTLIQEQNVVPGMTNSILSRFVRRVALGYADAASAFHGAKCVYTGNPIRRSVLLAEREESRAKLGIPAEQFTVLVAGGSRGAQSINNAMSDVLAYYTSRPEVTVMHVTGEAEYERMRTVLPDDLPQERLRVYAYLHDMPAALAAADLVVYRAGAVGLAELTARGLPAILVPYPYATADHQRRNAAVLERAGAATVIENSALTGAGLTAAIEELRHEPKRLASMAEASRRLGKPEAATEIAKLAFSLIG